MATKNLLTINEACERLAVGRTTLYRLVKRGMLVLVKLPTVDRAANSASRITEESIDALIEKGAAKGKRRFR